MRYTRLVTSMLSEPRVRSTRQQQDPAPQVESAQEMVAFFYDVLRDYPEALAAADRALKERYREAD
jgi:hypothetical protein